jgi:4-oxalocrotonate tautomerase
MTPPSLAGFFFARRDRKMPIVRVEIARGIATVDQKKAVIRGMTDVLVRELGRNPEYVFVIIDEVDTDNWGRKGQSLTELWQETQTAPDRPR